MRRVIDFATKEFFTRGVKQVTMDDIAKGLQMSKRTLYQLFADKAQLIIACIEVVAEKERILATSLIDEGRNVLETILCLLEYRLKNVENVSPEYLQDISKMDSVVEYIALTKQEAINRAVCFLQLGVEQGFFRNDVNFPLLTSSLLKSMDNTIDSEEFTRYSYKEIFINIGLFHLRGCCTPKGIDLIDAFLAYYRASN